MRKFKSNDSIIEAVHFTNVTKNRVFNSVTCNRYPDYEDDDVTPALVIQTSDGEIKVSFGDWVIKDQQGEYSSCKADVFESMYTEVEANV